MNVGFALTAEVKYGSEPPMFLRTTSGMIGGFIAGDVVVSQTEFAVINPDREQSPIETLVFFPGIVPNEPGVVVPMTDIFPELASVNFDTITDLYAVDGHIFMTLSGEDGLYLFGARDPSVIPEPATWVLLVLTAVAVGLRVCWRGRG